MGSTFDQLDQTNMEQELPSADADMHLLVGDAAIRSGLKSSQLGEMFDYYLSLSSAAGGLPSREQFNPAELPRHLPNIFMVECEKGPDGVRDFRYRVFGAALGVLFGAEMTGKLVSEYPGVNRARRSRKILDHVATLKSPVRTAGHFVSRNGMPIFGESIVLPFGQDGEVTHILADLDYDQIG